MVKVLIFFKRRPNLTPAEFRAYYEQHHAALSVQLAPALVRYKRNYRLNQPAMGPFGNAASGPLDDFDVVTEICFADRASFDETLASLSSPAVSARLIADEHALFDRAATRHYLVDEVESDLPSAPSGSATATPAAEEHLK